MKEYFYTNAQLAFVLKTTPSGQIDWDTNGFNVAEVSKKQAQQTVGNTMETILPIADKTKFNAALGNLIAVGEDDGEFYKVLSEADTAAKKAEFDALRAAADEATQRQDNANLAQQVAEQQAVIDTLLVAALEV